MAQTGIQKKTNTQDKFLKLQEEIKKILEKQIKGDTQNQKEDNDNLEKLLKVMEGIKGDALAERAFITQYYKGQKDTTKKQLGIAKEQQDTAQEHLKTAKKQQGIAKERQDTTQEHLKTAKQQQGIAKKQQDTTQEHLKTAKKQQDTTQEHLKTAQDSKGQQEQQVKTLEEMRIARVLKDKADEIQKKKQLDQWAKDNKGKSVEEVIIAVKKGALDANRKDAKGKEFLKDIADVFNKDNRSIKKSLNTYVSASIKSGSQEQLSLQILETIKTDMGDKWVEGHSGITKDFIDKQIEHSKEVQTSYQRTVDNLGWSNNKVLKRTEKGFKEATTGVVDDLKGWFGGEVDELLGPLAKPLKSIVGGFFDTKEEKAEKKAEKQREEHLKSLNRLEEKFGDVTTPDFNKGDDVSDELKKQTSRLDDLKNASITGNDISLSTAADERQDRKEAEIANRRRMKKGLSGGAAGAGAGGGGDSWMDDIFGTLIGERLAKSPMVKKLLGKIPFVGKFFGKKGLSALPKDIPGTGAGKKGLVKGAWEGTKSLGSNIGTKAAGLGGWLTGGLGLQGLLGTSAGTALTGGAGAGAAIGAGGLVAGAGAAGYGIGTLISKGIDKFGAEKLGQEKGTKGILGAWLFDKFAESNEEMSTRIEKERAESSVRDIEDQGGVLSKTRNVFTGKRSVSDWDELEQLRTSQLDAVLKEGNLNDEDQAKVKEIYDQRINVVEQRVADAKAERELQEAKNGINIAAKNEEDAFMKAVEGGVMTDPADIQRYQKLKEEQDSAYTEVILQKNGLLKMATLRGDERKEDEMHDAKASRLRGEGVDDSSIESAQRDYEWARDSIMPDADRIAEKKDRLERLKTKQAKISKQYPTRYKTSDEFLWGGGLEEMQAERKEGYKPKIKELPLSQQSSIADEYSKSVVAQGEADDRLNIAEMLKVQDVKQKQLKQTASKISEEKSPPITKGLGASPTTTPTLDASSDYSAEPTSFVIGNGDMSDLISRDGTMLTYRYHKNQRYVFTPEELEQMIVDYNNGKTINYGYSFIPQDEAHKNPFRKEDKLPPMGITDAEETGKKSYELTPQEQKTFAEFKEATDTEETGKKKGILSNIKSAIDKSFKPIEDKGDTDSGVVTKVSSIKTNTGIINDLPPELLDEYNSLSSKEDKSMMDKMRMSELMSIAASPPEIEKRIETPSGMGEAVKSLGTTGAEVEKRKMAVQTDLNKAVKDQSGSMEKGIENASNKLGDTINTSNQQIIAGGGGQNQQVEMPADAQILDIFLGNKEFGTGA